MTGTAKAIASAVALAVVLKASAFGQTAPATILAIDVENTVQYSEDTADFSKFATDPNIATANVPKNFWRNVAIGDIVAVNGQPAKGVRIERSQRLSLSSSSVAPGGAVADVNRSVVAEDVLEILKPDGTPIGTIMTLGLGVTQSPAPGAPLVQRSGNMAIVGGTGAFLGARGQLGAIQTGLRSASITEDPANRRLNGGGKVRLVLHVIPMEAPQIVSTANGAAVFHSDFSPVTAAKPATAGEVLISMATGLGPTVPGVDPGQAFPPYPANPLPLINSPVTATVNGRSTSVINATGWPGLVDTYRVDFAVPPGTASGVAAVQLSAAWLQGGAVSIPIQ